MNIMKCYAVSIYNTVTKRMFNHIITTNNLQNVLICKGTDTRFKSVESLKSYIKMIDSTVDIDALELDSLEGIINYFNITGLKIRYEELPFTVDCIKNNGVWLLCKYEYDIDDLNISILDRDKNLLNQTLQSISKCPYKSMDDLTGNTKQGGFNTKCNTNIQTTLDYNEFYVSAKNKLYETLIQYLQNIGIEASIICSNNVEFIKYADNKSRKDNV